MDGSDGTPRIEGTRFDDIRWVRETGSTNQDLLAEAAAGGSEGIVLVADHQTAGRGRLDRTWVAPPGASLLVSVLLRPTLGPDSLALLTMACGLAAVEGVEAATGVRLGLKWPNDLVVVGGPLGDRKVAGILAESHVVAGSIDAVVVGMGLNVDWPDELPTELVETAASLDRLAPATTREMVLIAWLTAYEAWLAVIESGRSAELLDAVRARSATVGRSVRVETASGSFVGTAVGITDDGALMVETDDGRTEIVRVGDIVHARIA